MTIPKDVQPLLVELGLELLDLRQRRHLVLYLRNRHGVSGTVTISKTPSDSRSRLNEQARLKRLAKLTTLDQTGITPGSFSRRTT
jgi:hypothetical protein